jgi:hypothetical protein
MSVGMLLVDDTADSVLRYRTRAMFRGAVATFPALMALATLGVCGIRRQQTLAAAAAMVGADLVVAGLACPSRLALATSVEKGDVSKWILGGVAHTAAGAALGAHGQLTVDALPAGLAVALVSVALTVARTLVVADRLRTQGAAPNALALAHGHALLDDALALVLAAAVGTALGLVARLALPAAGALTALLDAERPGLLSEHADTLEFTIAVLGALVLLALLAEVARAAVALAVIAQAVSLLLAALLVADTAEARAAAEGLDALAARHALAVGPGLLVAADAVAVAVGGDAPLGRAVFAVPASLALALARLAVAGAMVLARAALGAHVLVTGVAGEGELAEADAGLADTVVSVDAVLGAVEVLLDLLLAGVANVALDAFAATVLLADTLARAVVGARAELAGGASPLLVAGALAVAQALAVVATAGGVLERVEGLRALLLVALGPPEALLAVALALDALALLQSDAAAAGAELDLALVALPAAEAVLVTRGAVALVVEADTLAAVLVTDGLAAVAELEARKPNIALALANSGVAGAAAVFLTAVGGTQLAHAVGSGPAEVAADRVNIVDVDCACHGQGGLGRVDVVVGVLGRQSRGHAGLP